MKVAGLIGGMSWESTAQYYRIMNETVRQRLGGLHSARILLYSVDFQEIEQLQQQGDWQKAAAILADAARRLQRGGADFLLICTNTMHKVAAEVEQAVDLPLLHIADATGRRIQDSCLGKVGLLGTRYTMEESFYKGRLASVFDLEVMLPGKRDRMIVNGIIFDELCQGNVLRESREEFSRIIAELVARGAEGIILGCTEISLLVRAADSPVELFDTTAIHAVAAVDLALAEESQLPAGSRSASRE
ncbi:MAG: aspartate/glutamate racemase family protein [Deltaproteobacteria bacterium]|nr:aspartate/glutamate racemase family protein [Deltaproteobacteria bacterium]